MFKNIVYRNLNKIFKLSIILTNSKDKRFWNYNNYLLGYKGIKNTLIGVTASQKNIFLMMKLIILLKNIFSSGGKILFADNNIVTSEFIYKKVLKLNQYYISKPLNVSGSLSNFQHMRWYFLKSKSTLFPYKKPSLFILLDSYKQYFPLVKEAFKLSIPLVGTINFNNIESNKKFTYPLLLSNFNHNNKKLFYFEMFIYISKMVYNLNYINMYSSNYNSNNIFLKKQFMELAFNQNTETNNFSFAKYHNDEVNYIFSNKIINPVTQKLYAFTLVKRRIRPRRVQLYDYNKNKKWQWYRKKKFKYISKYQRNFIVKGKFKPPFSKIKWRYSLLKQIFCNLFDLQYNYKTWWREVIKKGLYKKIKKFSKNFTSAYDFLLSSERYFIFLIKKRFNLSSADLTERIKGGLFLLNGREIKNPQYVVSNGSIIQKKLFNNDVNICFGLFDDSRWELAHLWRQYFFRFKRHEDYKIDLFTKTGVPLIHPFMIDKLESKNILSEVYNKKMEFWYKFGIMSYLVLRKKLKLILNTLRCKGVSKIN